MLCLKRGISCNELGNAYLRKWQGSGWKAHRDSFPTGARIGAAQQMSESSLGILFIYLVQNSF